MKGQFKQSKHTEYIRGLLKEEENWGKFTRKELAKMATEDCGYPVTVENVRSVLRSRDAQKFTKHAFQARFEGKDRANYEANLRGIEDWNMMWLKDEETSIQIKNDLPRKALETVVEESIKEMKGHSPKYKTLKRTKITDPHLLIIDPADIHIGKLALAVETGEDYNIEIAKQRAIEGVKGLIDKSQNYPIEKVLLIVGNDILHFDTPRGTTTSGTVVETHGQLHQIYNEGVKLYVEIIEMLTSIADVHVVHNPSNHDWTSGYMMAQTIAAWFRLNKNVTFDVAIRHRKHYTYGRNLITTSHGDGVSHDKMHNLMSTEHPDWNNKGTQFRYIYLHHLHHKKVMKWQNTKDNVGVTLQVLRSPSAPDGWHDRNGFVGVPMAIEGFIHSKENGQIAQLTHYFPYNK